MVLQSIIDNANAANSYHIIIIDCGIDPQIRGIVTEQIAGHPNFSLKFENISAWMREHERHFREDRYLTKATYGRFAIPDLCAEYEKVIYADIDMVFNRDIAELMDINLGDNYIGAVPDIFMLTEYFLNKSQAAYVKDILHLGESDIYVNAGLIVFDISAWRANKLAEQCINLLGERKLRYLDQCAINAICCGHIAYLSPAWNFSAGARAAISANIEAAAEFPGSNIYRLYLEHKRLFPRGNNVEHYVGPVKPWDSLNISCGDSWWKYAAKTAAYSAYIARFIDRKIKSPGRSGRLSPDTVTYRFLGLPFWTVRRTQSSSRYCLGRLCLAKTRCQGGIAELYIFGIKLFERK